MGLDRPLLEQYLMFVGSSRGRSRHSYRQRVPVFTMVERRFPPTLLLASAALAITLLVSIPLGVYAASIAAAGRTGSQRLRRLRACGADLLGRPDPGAVLRRRGWAGAVRRLRRVEHLILPAFTVALAPIAGLTRLLRSSMIEVLESDYIKFLRIKGVPERQVLWKHGLRNAGLTALTFVGILIASLLTGSVVVETVFVWPGMGLLIGRRSVRDFAVVQGVVLDVRGAVHRHELLIDVLYGFLNPRLRTRRD